ncbi:TniQ family protein [Maridesulfovibrio sp.]|uniref:TniQ family protein n=1 Tax=Maridesulfovibrio sp. TaxID=2795000 RepID=UPI0039EFA961
MGLVYGHHPHILCKFALKKKHITCSTDLDIWLKDDDISGISKISGISFEELQQTSLSRQYGLFFRGSRDNKCWLDSQFSYSPTKRIVAICPDCLTNSSSPYLKKSWRLSFSTVCLQHKIRLLDRCPYCRYPFYLTEESIYNKKNPACGKCGMAIEKMRQQCTHSIFYNNKFYTDINQRWAVKEFNILKRIIDLYFGIFSFPNKKFVEQYYSSTTSNYESKINKIYQSSGTPNITLGEWDIECRHEVFRLAFAAYSYGWY